MTSAPDIHPADDALPETCEALHARMIAFETVNANTSARKGCEARLACFIERAALAWGLRAKRYPVNGYDGGFNLLVSLETAAPSDEWLLFDSHLDTVAAEGMTVPPFEATRRGTRIHGRGACDTKGSGAAMLWALRQAARSLAAQARRPARNTGVFFTVDEEAGMLGAAALARDILPAWPGPVRGVIVGEPTLMRPVVAHNGLLRWTCATRGVAAHSSDPSRGRSAISAMARVIGAFENHYAPAVAARTHPLTGGAAASINVIHGGTQVNIIPEHCEIEIDRRLAPQETPEAALFERDEFFAKLRQTAPETASVEIVGETQVLHPVDSSAPRNRAFHAWMAGTLERFGVDASPVGARYATNGCRYAAAGLPVIVMGPGDIAQAHTADEWIDAGQLSLAAAIYENLMLAP